MEMIDPSGYDVLTPPNFHRSGDAGSREASNWDRQGWILKNDSRLAKPAPVWLHRLLDGLRGLVFSAAVKELSWRLESVALFRADCLNMYRVMRVTFPQGILRWF